MMIRFFRLPRTLLATQSSVTATSKSNTIHFRRQFSNVAPTAAPIKVPAELIKQVRARTQAGMLNCKKALETSNLDIEGAIKILKAEGAILASKKTDKVTAEGCVAVAVNGNGLGVMIELNCQSDFGARGPTFRSLARRIARTAASIPASVELTRESLLKAPLAAAGSRDEESDASLDELTGTPIGDAITDVVGRIGEAVRLRRVERRTTASAAPNGLLAAYAHGGMDGGNGMLTIDSPDVALGRVASIVVLAIDTTTDNDTTTTTAVSLPETRSTLSRVGGQLAQHIVGFAPQFIERGEISDAYIEQLKANAAAAALNDKNVRDNKPDLSRDAIAKRSALLEQPYAVEQAPSVLSALNAHAKNLRLRKLSINGFARMETGDGIVPTEDNFADEVMKLAQLKQ